MDTQNPNNPNVNEPVFNVMPAEGKSMQPGGPAAVASTSLSTSASAGGSRKWTYIIIGIVVLLALAGGAYYLLGSKKETPQTNTSRLSKAWLNQYFNVDACSDQNTCGETSDPDKDGMGNYDEFREGTNPLNPDTDLDGLADGDEKNIYKTDPNLKYTDTRAIVAQNNWTDGFQIKNGFDPLTPAKAFTDARKKQIEDAIKQYKLHEPSVSTLGTNSTPTPSSSSAVPADWKTYTSSKHNFEFKYPNTSTVVENENGLDIKSNNNQLTMVLLISTETAAPPVKESKSIAGLNYEVYKVADETHYSTMRANQYYSVEFKNSNIAVVDQILSTFKFKKRHEVSSPT
jgi:hypothetical protein